MYGWTATKLTPGTYGYDNLVVCLYRVCEVLNREITICIEQLANLVHEAWIANYVYWRDNKLLDCYRKPYNVLGDEKRDILATTKFEDLDEEERHKDIVIAQFLLLQILGYIEN
jgi:hypothetical protein